MIPAALMMLRLSAASAEIAPVERAPAIVDALKAD